MNLAVRELTLKDLVVAEEIIRAAYTMRPGQHTGLERYLLLQPDGWLLVLSRDMPVALGGAMNYGSFGYIGLMSVLPAMQHCGIGRLLMGRLLTWFNARDCSTILLDASTAGAPLYLSMGFTVDDTVIELCHPSDQEYQLTPRDQGGIDTMQKADLPALVAFDTSYFGASRLRVLHSYLDDGQQCAFVARNERGEITGFLFVQANGRLGPWVAVTPHDADRLLMHVLRLPIASSEYSVQVPSANKEAQKLLLSYGFRQRRMLQHMRLGDPVQSRDRTKMYGQASFGLG